MKHIRRLALVSLVLGASVVAPFNVLKKHGQAASYSTLATSISAGYDLSCSLRADATVSCWGGMGTSSSPGDGSDSSSTPVDVSGLTGALGVSAGWEFSCAIDGDRNVVCWGGNYGPTANRVSGLTDVTQVEVGLSHACALKLDGSVWCWGSGTSGQLGNGGSTTSWLPVQAIISNATQIALGHVHSCALLSNQTVSCWGARSDPGPPAGSYWGEVGDGGANGSLTPVAVSGVSAATQLVAGSNQTCVVLTDGTIKCWGPDQSRTLDVVSCGLGPCFSSTPVTVSGISSVISLALSRGSSGGQGTICAVTIGGSIKCWGTVWTQGGYSWTQNYTPSQAKTMSGFSPSSQVVVGGRHLCSLTVNGTVECLGQGGAVGRGGTVDQTFESGRVVQIGATAPTAPTSFSATLTTSTSVNLNWSAPADLGGSLLIDYKIEFTTDSGTTWSTYDDGVSTNTGLSIGNLGPSALTTYGFRVTAKTMVGLGNPSEVKSVNVPPVPPSGEVGMSINQGANYTTDKKVSLQIVWPAGAESVRISNDGGFGIGAVSIFEPKAVIPWVLDDSIQGLYTKIVYIRFSGLGIDSSRSYQDDIIFDNKPPTVTSSAAERSGTYVIISLAANDEESGLAIVEVNNTDKTVNADYANTVLVKASDLGIGTSSSGVRSFGLENLRIRISDNAGNKTSWMTLGGTKSGAATTGGTTSRTAVNGGNTSNSSATSLKVNSFVSISKLLARLGIQRPKGGRLVLTAKSSTCRTVGSKLLALKTGTCIAKVLSTSAARKTSSRTLRLKVGV